MNADKTLLTPVPSLRIEVERPAGQGSSAYSPASARGKLQAAADEIVDVSAEVLIDLIVTPALCFAEAMDRLPESSRPSKVAMKFALKAGVEGSLYIAKANTGGAIEVTTTWEPSKT